MVDAGGTLWARPRLEQYNVDVHDQALVAISTDEPPVVVPPKRGSFQVCGSSRPQTEAGQRANGVLRSARPVEAEVRVEEPCLQHATQQRVYAHPRLEQQRGGVDRRVGVRPSN